ncbi:hypothetical protein [Burkholderia sp. GbtcB21]|uniref:hypothetical protein n=1 Tax=Burkholderia sp. GbtcB21 TaxID=2824766 RepID=UPI001C2FC5AE|nr:hypothetical protein [Burkholderia sp. GbtcB21]
MAEQEGLTPQEAAYFESDGAQTDGLSDAAPSSSEPVQQPATQAAEPAQDLTQQQQEPQQPDQRTVPLAALQEERAERKRLRDDLQRLQQQQDALVQRILANQQPQTQEPQVQIPDYATDPVGHLRATNEALQRQMQQMASYLSGQQQQQEQMTQQQQQHVAVANFIASHEQEFRSQAPDYDAAAAFLQQSRAEEYRALGMTNPIQIQNALQQDLIAMANIAHQSGTNVAQAAYNLAKARGYKAAAAAAPQGAPAAQQDNAARLAAVAQGQQHAASLSQAGGAAATPMSIEKLLAMSDADFAKATTGLNWQKLNAELSQ